MPEAIFRVESLAAVALARNNKILTKSKHFEITR